MNPEATVAEQVVCHGSPVLLCPIDMLPPSHSTPPPCAHACRCRLEWPLEWVLKDEHALGKHKVDVKPGKLLLWEVQKSTRSARPPQSASISGTRGSSAALQIIPRCNEEFHIDSEPRGTCLPGQSPFAGLEGTSALPIGTVAPY